MDAFVCVYIQYLIPAPSWVSENVNVGAPAAESSEVMIDPMSSVVVALCELESIDWNSSSENA